MQIVNSCGTCPAHGLVWDLESKQLKFKPPFYFITPLGDKGEVKDGYCEIPITKLTAKGEHRLRAVNGEGHVYPRADYTVHMLNTLNVGDMIKIRDRHCRSIFEAKA